MFDEETESAYDLLADVLVAYISDYRLEFFEGCTVSVAPVGAPPQWCTCMVDGVNDANIYWRGVPTAPGVGDEVLIWHNPLTHRREILAASGATGVSGGVHNLLSATHPDTTAAAVMRGDLVGGRVGPVWARVPLGTTGFFLKSDGTDFDWMRISAQTCVVGPGGTDETTTLGGAVAIVNAAGPPTAANPWVIIVRGMVTAEAGNVTIPQYCHVVGAGEGATVGMGTNTLSMSDGASLLDLVVNGTGGGVNIIQANNADCVIRNVTVTGDGQAGVDILGDSVVRLYDVHVIPTGAMLAGFYVADTANVLMDHCHANDETNFTYGLSLGALSTQTVIARYCVFRAKTTGDDVYTATGADFYHFDCDFRPVNSTLAAGTHTAQPTKRFNQWLFVAEQGGDFQLLSEAVTWINAQGDAAAGKRYGIYMVSGNYAEAGNVTVPSWVAVAGCGENSIIEMGGNVLYLSDDSSLLDLKITGSHDPWIVDINNADCRLVNVRVVHTAGGVVDCINIYGDSEVFLDHVSCSADALATIGVVVRGTSQVVLKDCHLVGNIGTALGVGDTANVWTLHCYLVGAGANDVTTGVNTTWYDLASHYDASKVVIDGTFTALPQSPVNLDGRADALILDADGDTTDSCNTDDQREFKIGGVIIWRWVTTALKSLNSIFPDLGTTTLAEKLGNVYLGTAKDIYPRDDDGGLFQRNVDHWLSPTDHFNTFSVAWTWANYAIFDGAPSTVDVATYPSLLRLMNDDITEDHFCYQAYAGTGTLSARLCKGTDSYVGIRIQNSDNDNDDFFEVRLIDGTLTGTVAIQRSYQVGGGGIVNTTLLDNLPSAFYLLHLYKTGAGNGFSYYGVNHPIAIGFGGVAMAFTAARWGVIFGQRGAVSSATRVGLVDFVVEPA